MFSVGIIAQNFEVFGDDIFDCKVLWMVGEGERNSVGFFVLCFLGAMFPCGYSRVGISAFFEKLAHSSHLSLKSASSLQRRLSLKKKLREWNGIFCLFWMRERM